MKKFRKIIFIAIAFLSVGLVTIGGEIAGLLLLEKRTNNQISEIAKASLSQADFVLGEVLESIINLEKLQPDKCEGYFATQSQETSLSNPMIAQVGLLNIRQNTVECTSGSRLSFRRSFSTPPVRDTGNFGIGLVYMRGTSDPYVQLSWRADEKKKIGVFALVSPKLFVVSDDKRGFETLKTRFEMTDDEIFDRKLFAYGNRLTTASIENARHEPFTGSIISQFIGDKILSNQQKSDNFPLRVVLSIPFNNIVAFNKTLFQILDLVLLFVSGGLVVWTYQIANRKPKQINLIKRGIKRHEFIPFYQPIVDLQTGKLMGCEVLVRWRMADGRLKSPNEFIDEAEKSGEIVPITRQLLKIVNSDLGEVYTKNRHLKVSFNLVSAHFANTDIIRDIREIFQDQDFGIRFSQLEWEITERFPLESLSRSRIVVKKMQQLGCRVLLDDAGTGHGGLAYLQELGMDTIKIDKIFVDTIAVTGGASPIVDMLINLSEQMSMDIIAEGVDDPVQIAYLHERGIRAVQGFLFHRPLPIEQYLEVIDRIDEIHPEIASFYAKRVESEIQQFQAERKRIA